MAASSYSNANTSSSRRGALTLGALVLAVVCAIQAVTPSQPAAEGKVGVLIGPPGHQTFYDKDQLEAHADVDPQDYTLRARPGGKGETNTYGGVSVRKLIQTSGGNPEAGFVTIPRPDGSSLYLDGSDFTDPPPFPEGPALFFVDSTSTHFFRPVRNSKDANARDNIATVANVPLSVGLHAGNILNVKSSASATKVKVKTPVKFTASATGGVAGEKYTYTWAFDDGKRATGPSVTHAYKTDGGYGVLVTATGDKDSGGQAAQLNLAVGKVKKGDTNGAGKGTEDKGKNGKNGTGTGNPTASPDYTPGYTGGSGYDYGGSSGYDYGGDSGGDYGATPSTPSPTPQPKTQQAPTDPSLVDVSGVTFTEQPATAAVPSDSILSSLTAATSQTSTGGDSAPTEITDPSSGDDDHPRFSVLWSFLSLAALMAAGAAWEGRGVRLWNRPA